jgi:hypothetical protein
LAFARDNGIEVKFGDPKDEVPGKNIILPLHPSMITANDADVIHMRRSLIKNYISNYKVTPTEADLEFLAAETNSNVEFVKEVIASL